MVDVIIVVSSKHLTQCQTLKRKKFAMAPTNIGANADSERGLRLKEEILKNLPKNKSIRSRAMAIDVGYEKYQRWEKGANIDNHALAAMAEMGLDITYILTGQRTTNQPTVSQEAGTKELTDSQEKALEIGLRALDEAQEWLNRARTVMDFALTNPAGVDAAIAELKELAEAKRRGKNAG
jgi:hypothetical protein